MLLFRHCIKEAHMSRICTADEGIAIGDVSRITGIPEHTIRYWEKEFDEDLSPNRTRGRQRRYTDSDIAAIVRIKGLLWEDNFSIRGARRILRGELTPLPKAAPVPAAPLSTAFTSSRIDALIERHLSPA